jgi:hypothetical protein
LRQNSEPKKLELGDKVILGLTTLCLKDGPAAIVEPVWDFWLLVKAQRG